MKCVIIPMTTDDISAIVSHLSLRLCFATIIECATKGIVASSSFREFVE